MNKLLTLVIPTYNMERFLPECLNTLIVDDEHMRLLEVLIVIDGSTDRSAQIGQEYADTHPDTFRVIIKDNGNYGSCVNRGLDEAKGKYIKTLDADDKFQTDNLSRFLSELQDVDADMVISDYIGWNMQTGQIDHHCYNLPTPDLFGIEQLKFEPNSPLMMHAVAYRTDLLRQMHYRQTEGIFYTDQEWTFMPVSRVNHIWYFPHTLYIYRVGREGQTVDIRVWVRHAEQEIVGLKKMTDFYNGLRSDSSPALRSFMEYRLYFRIVAIYNHIFVRSFGEVEDVLVSDFDSHVANSLPQLYLPVERDVRYHGLNVIGLWRRHPWLYRVYLRIRKFAHGLFK